MPLQMPESAHAAPPGPSTDDGTLAPVPSSTPPPIPREPVPSARLSFRTRGASTFPPPPASWRGSFIHVPDDGGERASRHRRLSRLSHFRAANAEIDTIFNERMTLPPRWTFYLPDFDYDVRCFARESLASRSFSRDSLGSESHAKETRKTAPSILVPSFLGSGISEKDIEGSPTGAGKFRVEFEPGDKGNPQNWPTWYRILVTVMFSYTTLATGIYSTAYASGIPDMAPELGLPGAGPVSSSPIPLLGISLYLVGLALGGLIMGPFSETFGRRPMYIAGLAVFLALIPVSALATNFSMVVVARFLGAVAGSVMLSNVSGSIVDISSSKYLPLALSVFSFGPLNGPVLGPLIGGFIAQRWGWRALAWMSLIATAPGALFIMTVPETYRPTLLRRMAARRRRDKGDDRYRCDFDDTVPLLRRVRTAVSRPFVLSFTQPVLIFWNIYISVIYAIVQLAYVSFPIVFHDERGWDMATSGLAFAGVFAGIALVLITEPLLRRLVGRLHAADPETGRPEPEATVLLICIGAVLEPLGQLVFALTSLPVQVPFIISILAGVPFGYGFGLVFIYGTNYIANVFGMYSASASAGNLVFRSIFGAVLVLVGKTMYASLTPRIAGVTVGAVELALMPVPFIFYKWGKRIRQRSQLIRMLEEQARKVTRGE